MVNRHNVERTNRKLFQNRGPCCKERGGRGKLKKLTHVRSELEKKKKTSL